MLYGIFSNGVFFFKEFGLKYLCCLGLNPETCHYAVSNFLWIRWARKTEGPAICTTSGHQTTSNLKTVQAFPVPDAVHAVLSNFISVSVNGWFWIGCISSKITQLLSICWSTRCIGPVMTRWHAVRRKRVRRRLERRGRKKVPNIDHFKVCAAWKPLWSSEFANGLLARPRLAASTQIFTPKIIQSQISRTTLRVNLGSLAQCCSISEQWQIWVRRFRIWIVKAAHDFESVRYKKSARSMKGGWLLCISREACPRPHLSFDAAQTYDRRPANFTLSRLGYRRPWLGAAALRLLLAKAPVEILLQTTYSDKFKGNGSKSPFWITQFVRTTSLMPQFRASLAVLKLEAATATVLHLFVGPLSAVSCTLSIWCRLLFLLHTEYLRGGFTT